MTNASDFENVWIPIEDETPESDLVLIKREVDGLIDYIHCAYLRGDDWYLPFDSARSVEDGTPILSDDELPTEWAILPEN